MNPAPQHQVLFTPADRDVYRVVRQLRVLAGLMVLAVLVVILAGTAGVIVQLLRPRPGSLAAVVLSGVVGLVALAVGVVLLESTDRRAKNAQALHQAVMTYRTGCLVAGAVNFSAGLCTLVVVFATGLAGGFLLPLVLVAGINILGLCLSVPRIKHLRKIHYTPTLPYSRV